MSRQKDNPSNNPRRFWIRDLKAQLSTLLIDQARLTEENKQLKKDLQSVRSGIAVVISDPSLTWDAARVQLGKLAYPTDTPNGFKQPTTQQRDDALRELKAGRIVPLPEKP